MEEYRKIWERAPKVSGEDFVFSEEIWKKHYATSKILNNTFRAPPGFRASTEDNEGPSKKQAFKDQLNTYKKKIKWKEHTGYRYLFSMHPDPVCPRFTNSDDVEQEVYFFLRQKLSSKTGKATMTLEENTLFNELHHKMVTEQVAYCKYVESLWGSQRKKCVYLHEDIKKFVNEVWKNRLSAVNNYPPKYREFKMVPLVFAGDSKLVRALPSKKYSISLGIASRYTPPQMGARLKLCTDYNEIKVQFPPEEFKSRVPVSRDKTAQEIARSCRPDVVISMGGLNCIVDNFKPDHDREWDIPIVIRDESRTVETKVSKRIIYIDKPLPPRSMTAVDKNKWYNKYAVRALFCRVRNEGLHRSIVPLSPDELGGDTQAAGSSKNQQRDKRESGESSGNDEFPEQLSEEGDHCASDSSAEKLVIACSDDEKLVKGSQIMTQGKLEQETKSCGVSQNSTADTQSVTVTDVNVQKEIKTYGRQSKTDFKQGGNKSDSLSASPNNKSDSPKSSMKQENVNIAETSDEQCASMRIPKQKNMNMLKPMRDKCPSVGTPKQEKVNTEDTLRKEYASLRAPKVENANIKKKLDKQRPSVGTPKQEKVNTEETVGTEYASLRAPKEENVNTEEKRNEQSASLGAPKKENVSTPKKSGEKSTNVRALGDESINEPCLMSHSCVTYKQWKLMLDQESHEETRANFLKNENRYKPIVMLVRNKQDAVRIQSGVTTPVLLATKQEYQAEYGMSKSSMSDICRQWMSLYFRPNCTLVRARIDATSHEALLVEEKDLPELALESYDQRIRSTLLSTLYSVLLGLRDLEPGNYLLSHRKKMGPFASLMKASTGKSSINLNILYGNVDVDGPEPAKDYPWSPIDCNLQTPSQHRRRRVPGLFPIRPSNIRSKAPTFAAKRSCSNTENKKKKKKKKKKPAPPQ